MRAGPNTTVDEASAMGAITSNHNIETIPEGDTTTIETIPEGDTTIFLAGLCWAPTGAWSSRSEVCASDVMIECNAQFRRPLWRETIVSGE